MTDREANISALEAELEECKKASQALSAEMTESRKLIRKSALASLRRARSDHAAAAAEHEKAAAERELRLAELRSCGMGMCDYATVRAELERDITEAVECRKLSERRNSPAAAIIALLLAIACAVAGVLFDYFFSAGTAVFAAASGLLLRRRKIRIAQAETAGKRLSELLEKYHVRCENSIRAQAEEFFALHDAFIAADKSERSAASHLEACRKKLDELENRTLDDLDFFSGDGEAAELTRTYNETVQRCQALSEALAKLKND